MFFIGHQENWKKLNELWEAKKFPQALLLYGMPGIGKKILAKSLVQKIFDESTLLDSSRVFKNQHPDFFAIEEGEEKIKIDAIRDLQKKLTKSPLEAPCQMVLIDNASHLTLQAANSLLKILEEPPEATYFFLISSNLFQILPTIRSRCFRLSFFPPPHHEFAPLLKEKMGIEENKALKALAHADGSLGMALQFLSEEMETSLNEFEFFLNQKNILFSQISGMVQGWVEREIELFLLIELMKKFYFKKIKDTQNWDLIYRLDQIHSAQKDIQNNVNKTLVLENLLLELAQ